MRQLRVACDIFRGSRHQHPVYIFGTVIVWPHSAIDSDLTDIYLQEIFEITTSIFDESLTSIASFFSWAVSVYMSLVPIVLEYVIFRTAFLSL